MRAGGREPSSTIEVSVVWGTEGEMIFEAGVVVTSQVMEDHGR